MQLAQDICRKLLKYVYGPNQSLDNLLQLGSVCYSKGYKEKRGREKQRNRWKPL